MSTPTPTRLGVVDRDDAIAEIAAAVSGRTHYVVTPPVDGAHALAQRLADLPGWVAYIDNGTPLVLKAHTAELLAVTDVIGHATGQALPAVFTVDKAVPAADLGAVLAQPALTPDRDLIMLTADDDQMTWPELLVAAFDLADPEAAAAIRAVRDPASDSMPAPVRAILERFQQRARRGEVAACSHLAGAGFEGMAVWTPWAPGRVRCEPCRVRAGERMRRETPAYDHSCDGCGADSRVAGGGLRSGLIEVTGVLLPRLPVPVDRVVVEFSFCSTCGPDETLAVLR